MSLVLYIINGIYLGMKISAGKLLPKAIFQNSPDCGSWKSIFSHLVVCTCSFYFPRGNTCNQLMNCCLWIQLSLSPCSGKGLINMTGMCLQMYHWDANCEPIFYCICRYFFKKQIQLLEGEVLNFIQWIFSFDSILMAKIHSYIPHLSHHSNFSISSPPQNSKKLHWISQKVLKVLRTSSIWVLFSIMFFIATVDMCPLRQFRYKTNFFHSFSLIFLEL